MDDFDRRLHELVRTAQVRTKEVVLWEGYVSPEDALLYVLWTEESVQALRELGVTP